MKESDDNKKTIEKLKQMPNIQDDTDKDELYKRISSKVHHDQPKWNKKIVPILGAIMAIAIIFVMLPMVLGNMVEQSSDKSSERSVSNKDMEGDEESTAHHSEESLLEKDEDDRNFKAMNVTPKGFIVQTLDESSQIIGGTFSDTELEIDIPVAFIVPKSAVMADSESKIVNYINDDKWGFNDYLTDDFSFKINKDHNNEISNSSYMLYNYRFLIPIPQEDQTPIDDALNEMKYNRKTYNIYATIPDNIDFSIDSSESKLIINFKVVAGLGDNQETITMIEAILMTAKSYDYEAVDFENLPTDQIGSYNVSTPLKVPEAINPVYLQE